VVAIDTVTSDLILTDPDQVTPYDRLYERLWEAALPPEDSLDLLASAATGLSEASEPHPALPGPPCGRLGTFRAFPACPCFPGLSHLTAFCRVFSRARVLVPSPARRASPDGNALPVSRPPRGDVGRGASRIRSG
jgi:hypothetical protein